MDTFLQDLRYACRTLTASRGVSLLAISCLAVGIGVNGTIFSVVNAIALRPFAFNDPERILVVKEIRPRSGIDDAEVSYLNLRDYREQNRTFSDMGGVGSRSQTIADKDEPERVLGGAVSWNLFPMLGVAPAVGRGIRQDEDRPGGDPVVLLSDDLWQRRYQRDPAAIGRSVLVNNKPHTVIGIMPPRFRFPFNNLMWVPLAHVEDGTPRDVRSVLVMGRLRPEVTIEQARSDLNTIGGALAAQYPENNGWTATAVPVRSDFIPEDINLVVFTMMGAVTLVLIIACANVANLLMARATARHREIALRAALGAGRLRIVRQLLTESMLLGLVSAPPGIALAYLGLNLLDKGIPGDDQVPYYIDWSMDTSTLTYIVIVSLVTGVIFGLAPAVQAARGNLQEALKEGNRGAGAASRSNRLRSTLVVAEVALSMVLLIGASLFVRSFVNLQHMTGGFDTAPLMTLRFYMPGDAYQEDQAKAQRVDDIVRRIESLPGVEAATASNLIPMSSGGDAGGAVIDGQPVTAGDEPIVFHPAVTPHFFRTLNVPILQGRDFTDLEGTSLTAVAVINQTMADRFWPKGDPLGRRFRLLGQAKAGWFTVIGVTPDIMNDQPDGPRDAQPSAYLPYPYSPTPNTGLMMRVAGDPASVTSAAREAIRASDSALPVFSIYTMEELRRLGYWQYRLFGWMFSIFGAVALLLAAVGVYGVLSYAVTLRTHEIGIRMALGAETRDVHRLIVGHGLTLATIGIGLGLLGAFGVTRIVASLLVDVSPTDPLSFAAIAAFLAGIGFMASYLPARRALAVDPIVALREE